MNFDNLGGKSGIFFKHVHVIPLTYHKLKHAGSFQNVVTHQKYYDQYIY